MMQKFRQFIQKNSLWPFLVFAIAILLVYLNVLNAPFVVDDKDGILNNPLVGRLDSIYNYPNVALRNTVLYISYHIGHFNPLAYRIFNLLFHFGTVSMLYLIVKKLLNRKVALLAALLFAIHPLLIESVTWISAVTYPQYSFFLMFALFAYIKGKESKKWFVTSVFLYLLSMMSSEKAVVFPAILFFLELSFFNLKKNWKRIIPFVVIAGVIGGMLLLGVGARVASFQKDYYIAPQFYNPVEHIPYAITYYLQLMFFPKDLTIYHSELSITIQEFLIRWAIFIALIVTIVTSFSKKKHLFFWLMFYFIAVSPTLIPFNIVWVVAERYVYLGTAGVLVVVAMGLVKLLEKKKLQTVSYAVVMVIILILMGRTIVRNADWLSDENLWTSTVAVSPNSSNAHNNMGDIYTRRNDYANAAIEFQRAIELQPGDADPRHNLGIAYTVLRRYPEAIEAYQGALSIDPTLYNTHQNLAVVYYTLKNYKEAEDHLVRALQYGPANPVLSNMLKEVKKFNGQ